MARFVCRAPIIGKSGNRQVGRLGKIGLIKGCLTASTFEPMLPSFPHRPSILNAREQGAW
ncbi:MAG: hypothetical protein RRB12_12595 [Armatimonadota bacterium]|nr:hypothetical protein [Armatimonadota bacterium]